MCNDQSTVSLESQCKVSGFKIFQCFSLIFCSPTQNLVVDAVVQFLEAPVQARSQVPFPMVSLEFFIAIILAVLWLRGHLTL